MDPTLEEKPDHMLVSKVSPEDRQGQAHLGITEEGRLRVKNSEKWMESSTQHLAIEAT